MKKMDVLEMRNVEAGKFDIQYVKDYDTIGGIVNLLGYFKVEFSLGEAFQKYVNIGILKLRLGENVYSVSFPAVIGVSLKGPVGYHIDLGYTNKEI